MNVERANTILYCHRWKESVAFYKEVLGLRPTVQREWFVEFQLSNHAYISVADDRRTSVKSSAGTGVTVSIAVENVQAARDQIASRGGTPEKVRSVWGSKAFFVYDPEGYRIEFWE